MALKKIPKKILIFKSIFEPMGTSGFLLTMNCSLTLKKMDFSIWISVFYSLKRLKKYGFEKHHPKNIEFWVNF